MLYGWGYDPSEENLSKAASAAKRALTIDEANAEAHASLGYLRLLEWRWEEARAQLRRALQLNPGYAFAHDWYADLLLFLRRDEEALRHYRRALELDPLSWVLNLDISMFYSRTGNFEAAIQGFRKTLELHPNDYFARRDLSRALAEQGREREAFEVLLGQDFPTRFKADLREVYGVSGYWGVRREALEVRVAETKRNCTDDVWGAVVTLAHLGEDDRMFECLRELVELGGNLLILRDFSLQKYRSDPRFIAILKQMRLEKYWRG
jgi:tetratricopeptide (TPR) repeat protein